MGGFAWVTLATNDSYSLGALVLAHSLKQVGTGQQLAVLITPGVTASMREKLSLVFDVVQEVNILDSRDEANLRLLNRPELGVTFTKLHCWRLTQYDKCVFLDADTLVLQNCDELFEREELSAAPDVGWPDCFNSGVFVYRPSNETYEKLVQFALEKGSFDGGDQGLLNLYFSDWATKDISKHLPFIYNLCSTACYSYLPAFKQFGSDAKIIHFIGASKPWLQYFNTETRKVQPTGDFKHLEGVLQHWWNFFCSLIHPKLTPDMSGLAGAFAQLTLGAPRTSEQSALDDHLRRQGWEVGNIDYLGRDSFDNIWSKICQTLSVATGVVPTPPQETPEISPPQAIPTETAVSESSEITQPVPEATKTVPTAVASVIDSLQETVPTETPQCPLILRSQETPTAPQPEAEPLAEVESPQKQELPKTDVIAPSPKETPTAPPETIPVTPTPAEAVVPEATPVVPEATPVVPEATPVVPEATPVVPEATPVVPEATPVVPEATPVVPEAAPVVPEATPVVPEATPVVPEATPVVPEVTPVVPQATPAIPQAAPVVPKVAPVVPKAAPVVPKAAPIVPEAAPAVAEVTPVVPQATPERALAKTPQETVKGPLGPRKLKTGTPKEAPVIPPVSQAAAEVAKTAPSKVSVAVPSEQEETAKTKSDKGGSEGKAEGASSATAASPTPPPRKTTGGVKKTKPKK